MTEIQVKEKLEQVIPMIESGFVYSFMFGNLAEDSAEGYLQLLEVEKDCGFAMVVACGEEFRRGELSNPVGSGVRLQRHIPTFREIVKKATGGFVGTLMGNKVVVLISCEKSQKEYEERLYKIEMIRGMLWTLEHQIDLKFKAGIGTVRKWSEMCESCREAMDGVRQGNGKVVHISDIEQRCIYEETYPDETERELFLAVKEGNLEGIRQSAICFLKWMESSVPRLNHTARLKAIEFVLRAEQMAYMQGGMMYRFADREGYLEEVLSFGTYETMERWLVGKLEDAGGHILQKQGEKSDNVVERAKSYILSHFPGEFSLEEVAKEIGISPYYLSRLFKETEQVNYIDYVTGLRMEFAKEQLGKGEKSIKEVCYESGYGDPNYFSRIFKKWTGRTPTEFREGRRAKETLSKSSFPLK